MVAAASKQKQNNAVVIIAVVVSVVGFALVIISVCVCLRRRKTTMPPVDPYVEDPTMEIGNNAGVSGEAIISQDVHEEAIEMHDLSVEPKPQEIHVVAI